MRKNGKCIVIRDGEVVGYFTPKRKDPKKLHTRIVQRDNGEWVIEKKLR